LQATNEEERGSHLPESRSERKRERSEEGSPKQVFNKTHPKRKRTQEKIEGRV